MKIFENEMFGSVRTIEKDNNVWFVGKDVAEILGYKNNRTALANHIDDEDKMRWQITTPLRGTQQTVIINESGLYCLVLSSKLPIAKAQSYFVVELY